MTIGEVFVWACRERLEDAGYISDLNNARLEGMSMEECLALATL
jgi:hypothetical protein